jgi:hypothetical protein
VNLRSEATLSSEDILDNDGGIGFEACDFVTQS